MADADDSAARIIRSRRQREVSFLRSIQLNSSSIIASPHRKKSSFVIARRFFPSSVSAISETRQQQQKLWKNFLLQF